MAPTVFMSLDDFSKGTFYEDTDQCDYLPKAPSAISRICSKIRHINPNVTRGRRQRLRLSMVEGTVEHCLQTLEDISTMLDNDPSHHLSYVERGRGVMSTLDSLHIFNDPAQLDMLVKAVWTLQRLAFIDVDNHPINDVAEWCLQRWLLLLQSNPENARILQGIGKWWLNKAQPLLARINAEESSSSSGSQTASRPTGMQGEATHRHSEEDRQASRASSRRDSDAEARLHTQDYVEVRGILLPAVEYLRRAVDEAESHSISSGSLLVTAAEAYMSLGNVSYARTNTEYFRQAIVYLRQASSVPGFPLPGHLQRYLDDYGPLVD